MVFEQNIHPMTSNKYYILNKHKKLSRSMYVWNCFGDFRFRRNCYLWSPTGICEKINLIRTNILAVIHGSLCHQTPFHNLRTFFPFSKSLFHSSYIFTYSWGGPQVKIWPEKKSKKQLQTNMGRLRFLSWFQIHYFLEVKQGSFCSKTIEY